MRDILYIELSHMNNQFNRSGDMKDLSIASNLHIGMAERYSYTDEQQLKNSLLTISDADYTPQDKDKLYFLPGTSVPRIKLKDLASNRGIKTTRKIETADAIFASKGTLNKLTDYNWEYPFNTENFKKWMVDAKDFFDEERDYENLETALEHYTEHEVLLNWSSWRMVTDDNTPFYINSGKDPNGEDYGSNERYLRITEGKEDIVKALLSNTLCTVYDESTILQHVNGDDCVTIDDTIYHNLTMMLESSDTDNHILAMEIMANSNYNESLLHLELIFLNFWQTIDSRREKNHVNFKSLLSYLDKSPSYMHTTLDSIMNSLRGNGQMTVENVSKLLILEANKNLSLSGSTQFFKIKSVTLDPEYLAEMNHNLDFKVQEDFTPIIIEEEEVENEIENELPQVIVEEENPEEIEKEEIEEEVEENGGFNV